MTEHCIDWLQVILIPLVSESSESSLLSDVIFKKSVYLEDLSKFVFCRLLVLDVMLCC
jgi:hypothetical protein